MSKTISVFNQKGGVGKTTTASNLMAELSFRGFRVLGIDADNQGNLTSFLNVDTDNENTLLELLSKEATFVETVVKTKYGDVVPCDGNLRLIAKVFAKDVNSVFSIQDIVDEQKDNYDYVIIDCPPNAEDMSVCSLVASNFVVVPMEMAYFSINGVLDIAETVLQVKKRLNPKLVILGALIVKYQERLKLTAQLEEFSEVLVSEKLGCDVFKTKIHSGTAIPSSQAMKVSLRDFDSKTKLAQEFSFFVDEIIEGVKKNG